MPRKLKEKSSLSQAPQRKWARKFPDPNGDFAKSFIAASKLGRTGTPKDIAPAVVFLASENVK